MTGRRTNIIAATVVAGLILTTAGCGKVADKVSQKASEKATEKIIENETGGSVDLNTSDGKMKIKTKDGEVTYGSGSELPKGWPSDVKLPKGITLNASTSSKTEGGVSMIISGTVAKGKAKSVYGTISSNLKSAGYKLDNESEMTSGGSFSATVTGTKSNRSVGVTVTETGDGVYVMMTVTPNN